MVNGGKKFKFIPNEGQTLSFQVPRNSRGKALESTFDLTEEFDDYSVVDEDKSIFSLKSDLFDCSVCFGGLDIALSFVVRRGLECEILKNGVAIGLWNPVSGYYEYGRER